MKGKSSRAETNIGFRTLQQFPRGRSGQDDGRPALGDGRQVHVQIRPFRLQPLLQPAHYPRRAAGSGGQVKMPVAQARHDPVIHDHAVLAQHDAVVAAPVHHPGDIMGVDTFQEGHCIRTLHLYLAQGGGIHDCQRPARREAFPGHRVVHPLAFPGIIPGAQPLPYHFKFGPGRLVPVDAERSCAPGHRDRRLRRRRRGRSRPPCRAAGRWSCRPRRRVCPGTPLIPPCR